MSEGEIQQEGRPQDVYREPANAFVASFIGMNNLVRGEMAGLADGFIKVRNDVATFRVPANRPVAVGERVAFVIAADWISIVTNGEEPRQGPVVAGTVLGLEFVGSTQTVFVEVPGLGEFRVQKQQHDIEALRLVPGREVALGWAPGRAWLLPAEN
jgi:spermidine/putrescine transport system ATP-binding protein